MTKRRVNSYVLFESSFLALELMSFQNTDFVSKEFKHIIELESAESQWESNPEWLIYFNKRPIGIKPIKTKTLSINPHEFSELLRSCGLYKFDRIEIRKDRLGDYSQKIKDCFGFGTSNFGIFFTVEDDLLNQAWVDVENSSTIDNQNLIIALFAIATNYNMILVDWIDKKIVNIGNKEDSEIYLIDLE